MANIDKKIPFTIFLEKTLKFLITIFVELYRGVRTNTIPWFECLMWASAVNVAILFGADTLLAEWAGVNKFYEKAPEIFFVVIYLPVASLGFWAWAIRESFRRKKLSEILTKAFLSSKLKNYIGKVPNFISDYQVDEHTRKLHLTSEAIPLDTFNAQKKHLESALRIYIDEIKQDLDKGTTTIQYSHIPMPEKFDFELDSVKTSLSYVAGCTRSKIIRQSFKDSPHLLIGGQTGGGKSTLLRQIITSIYLKDKSSKFQLIDLKAGLEFQTFKDLERVEVIEDLASVKGALHKLDLELTNRMKIIKDENCKDIEAFLKKKSKEVNSNPAQKKNKISLGRRFVVIDEAAEIFLGGAGEKLEDIQRIRKAISRIARLGRACGMHLIIATQRPDVKALDPQVKANLTSVISFQMPNLASSMTILGNGKAAKLPFIPGRAILRSGNKLLDIQTPFLSVQEAESLLQPHRVKKSEEEKVDATEQSKENKGHSDLRLASVKKIERVEEGGFICTSTEV